MTIFTYRPDCQQTCFSDCTTKFNIIYQAADDEPNGDGEQLYFDAQKVEKTIDSEDVKKNKILYVTQKEKLKVRFHTMKLCHSDTVGDFKYGVSVGVCVTPVLV